MYFKTVQQAWSRSFFRVKLRIQSQVSSFLSRNFIPVHAKIYSRTIFLQQEFCTICRCTILSTNLTCVVPSQKKKENWDTQSIFNFDFFIYQSFSCRCLRMKHFFIEAGGFPLFLGDDITNDHMNVQKRFPFLRTHPVVIIYRYTYMLDC